MSSPTSEAIARIMAEVRNWPNEQRRSLMEQISSTLIREQAPKRTKKPLRDLIGILKVEGTPPTDEGIQKILDEEKMRKYGT
jgi:hypothetical protein